MEQGTIIMATYTKYTITGSAWFSLSFRYIVKKVHTRTILGNDPRPIIKIILKCEKDRKVKGNNRKLKKGKERRRNINNTKELASCGHLTLNTKKTNKARTGYNMR